MTSGTSGVFFKGLAQLLEAVLKAVEKIRDIGDQGKRRDAACDLLAACMLVADIVKNGGDLLKLAGTDPVDNIVAMSEEERRPYAIECHQKLSEQINRLVALSRLLEDAPVLQIVDANLKSELDTIIGTKEKGLMSIAAPVGFYLSWGPIPEEEDVAKYGKELASMRYQSQVLAVVFSGNSPDANAHIDVEAARRNLEDLRSTGDRLRKHVTELFSQDEIVLLAKQAERRAHSLTAKPDSLETGITTGKNR